MVRLKLGYWVRSNFWTLRDCRSLDRSGDWPSVEQDERVAVRGARIRLP